MTKIRMKNGKNSTWQEVVKQAVRVNQKWKHPNKVVKKP